LIQLFLEKVDRFIKGGALDRKISLALPCFQTR